MTSSTIKITNPGLSEVGEVTEDSTLQDEVCANLEFVADRTLQSTFGSDVRTLELPGFFSEGS
jgi:hypothetical protein